MTRNYPAIERVILDRGRRGMGALAEHLPVDYCARAARAVWEHRERTLITTGFYVSGHPENDGPLGAFFLAQALARCGAQIGFVAEEDTLALLAALDSKLWDVEGKFIDLLPFPITNPEASKHEA